MEGRADRWQQGKDTLTKLVNLSFTFIEMFCIFSSPQPCTICAGNHVLYSTYQVLLPGWGDGRLSLDYATVLVTYIPYRQTQVCSD